MKPTREPCFPSFTLVLTRGPHPVVDQSLMSPASDRNDNHLSTTLPTILSTVDDGSAMLYTEEATARKRMSTVIINLVFAVKRMLEGLHGRRKMSISH